MSSQEEILPFGLTQSELASVKVFYAYYSAKTGAGKQEISISGDNSVELLLTRSRDAEPNILKGQLTVKVFIRLLDFIEGENIFEIEDHFPPEGHPHARRVLKLSLPERTKTILLDEPVSREFERIAGAVKFAAGIALAEALQQRYFPNL